WKYLFTLQDGRMSVFEHDSFDNMCLPAKHVALEERDPKRISLGDDSLDKVLGGAPKGGLLLVEIGEDVPQDFVHWFETNFLMDALSKNRGTVWYPNNSLDYGAVEKQIRQMVGLQRPADNLCILDPGNQGGVEVPFARTVEGADASHDLRWDQLRFLLSSAKSPYISILGFDAIEDVYGRDALPKVMPFVDAMRRGGHVILAEATTVSASLPYLSHQAKMHLKFESINGTVLICGQKPFTPYYHVECQTVDGVRSPVLIPML
ncbi:MAG TPA: hypothetical protein VLH13_02270, partial [Methanomassiliicoccales archaeon]|nr:hypothetical protein [Methanomassiliicoccales archaeon]